MKTIYVLVMMVSFQVAFVFSYVFFINENTASEEPIVTRSNNGCTIYKFSDGNTAKVCRSVAIK